MTITHITVTSFLDISYASAAKHVIKSYRHSSLKHIVAYYIWRYISGSTLAQKISCYLTALSHKLELTYHHKCSVAFTCEQFHKKCSSPYLPRADELMMTFTFILFKEMSVENFHELIAPGLTHPWCTRGTQNDYNFIIRRVYYLLISFF